MIKSAWEFSLIYRYTKFHLEIMPVKAWATPSEFQVLLEALGQWKAGLPPELALTTSNLFARQATAEFESLISLHALHDQLYGDLYRIALPGFPESASVGYLADAPVDWVTRVRFGCYVRALALTDKFKLLKQYFPHYTPVDRLWRMFAYESIRNQLQYLHVTTVAVQQSEGEREETVSGFETIVETIGKMTTYYSSMTSLVCPSTAPPRVPLITGERAVQDAVSAWLPDQPAMARPLRHVSRAVQQIVRSLTSGRLLVHSHLPKAPY